MARKLIRSARQRWRAANEPHLIAVARAGTPVDNGRLARRAEPVAAA